MNRDLTKGEPGWVLWSFSLPMFISVIFQQMYNIADSVIAGRFAGEEALAAVGASYPITMIFMAVAIGSNIGCSVVISSLFGAGRFRDLKTAISTSLLTAGGLSVILTLGGLTGTEAMMRLIQTPDNIFGEGSLYLAIYIGGFTFVYLYNVSTGIFTALGDSQTPLYLLIGSSLGNIFLDYLFVAGFHWGVAGVAWATFIAQGAACLLALALLRKRVRAMEYTTQAPLFSGEMLVRIGRIAIPSILQQSFISVGNFFIQGLINSYGSSVIAGYSAAIKLNTFAITGFTTLGNGVSNFTAQNLGAGREDRVKSGYRAGVMISLLAVLPFFTIYFFFGKAAICLFMTGDSVKALSIGVDFLRLTAPFYAVIAIKLMADGVLRGSGSMTYFMIATFTDLLLRVILAFVLSGPLGTRGIWLSWPIGWSVAMILSVTFYIRGVWKPRKPNSPALSH